MQFRAAFAGLLAIWSALVLTPLGCSGAQEEYTFVPHPQERPLLYAVPRLSAEVPTATVRQWKACLERHATRLTESSYALQYDAVINDRGEVIGVKLRDATLHDTEVEGCIRQAIQMMLVPVQTLGLRSSRPASVGGPMTREQRGLLSSSESDSPLVLLGPLIVETVGTNVLIEIGAIVLASVATLVTGTDEEKANRECETRNVDCLMSDLASRKGSVRGHSMCLWCRDTCRNNNGIWPSSVRGMGNRRISCEYWRK